MITSRFLLCTLLLCLCEGAPPREKPLRKYKARENMYTREEEMFIIDQLKFYANTYRYETTWPKIAAEHRRKRKTKTPGFYKKRSTFALFVHFFRMTKRRERSEDSVIVPDALKISVRRPTKHFTQQEDDFINHVLRKTPSGTELGSYTYWKQVAKEHKEIWESGTKDFPVERSFRALESRFRRMKEDDKIDDKVKRKHQRYFYFNKGDSSSKAKKFAAAILREEDTKDSDRELSDPSEPEIQETSNTRDSDREFCDILDGILEEASSRSCSSKSDNEKSDREFCDFLEDVLEKASDEEDETTKQDL